MALILPDGDEELTISFNAGGTEETLSVTLGPETFGTVLDGMQWVRTKGLWDGKAQPDDMASLGLANYQLICRIKDWKGPETAKGKKFPCTLDNKMVFFGKYPNALNALWEALGKQQETQRKNSKPSRTG